MKRKGEKMSLQVIYGKSGTGKSTYIFQEIAKKLKMEVPQKRFTLLRQSNSLLLLKKNY